MNLLFFLVLHWPVGPARDAFIFGAGGLRLQILGRSNCKYHHSVANGSPPLQHFFKKTCHVARAHWCGYGPRKLVTRFGVTQFHLILVLSVRCISDRPENIQDSIKDCHRAVVFLTDSYIKDDWSVMAMQKVCPQIKKLVIDHTWFSILQNFKFNSILRGLGENYNLLSKF